MAYLSKVIDEVRAHEARQLKAQGFEPVAWYRYYVTATRKDGEAFDNRIGKAKNIS